MQLRPQLQLLHQQLLLRQLLQLLNQLCSPLLHLLKFRRLRQLQHRLLLHNLLQLQHQHPRRHIQCLGMNLRLPELQLRLLTMIRFLTAMTM